MTRRDGRRWGQGDLLEDHTEIAFNQLDYRTLRGEQVFGRQADVIALKPGGYPRRLAIQCKDWKEEPVYPCIIYRLIAVSFALHAHPVLIHNTELSEEAKKICMGWNVRTIPTDSLEMSYLPGPVPVEEEDFVRLPKGVEDTLPIEAPINPIYDPFHPRFQKYFLRDCY